MQVERERHRPLMRRKPNDDPASRVAADEATSLRTRCPSRAPSPSVIGQLTIAGSETGGRGFAGQACAWPARVSSSSMPVASRSAPPPRSAPPSRAALRPPEASMPGKPDEHTRTGERCDENENRPSHAQSPTQASPGVLLTWIPAGGGSTRGTPSVFGHCRGTRRAWRW